MWRWSGSEDEQLKVLVVITVHVVAGNKQRLFSLPYSEKVTWIFHITAREYRVRDTCNDGTKYIKL